MPLVLQGSKKKKNGKGGYWRFDCCHSFIESCVYFILRLIGRKFVHVTHLVGRDKFFIFVSYNKEQFNTKINQFVTGIIKESKNWDDLPKYWNVNSRFHTVELNRRAKYLAHRHLARQCGNGRRANLARRI